MLDHSKMPVFVGASLSLFLYFLLPGTSALFFELYHLTELEFMYWFYSGTKLAAVFYPRWAFFEVSLITAGLVLALILFLRQKRQQA